jgi:hypothetical protein
VVAAGVWGCHWSGKVNRWAMVSMLHLVGMGGVERVWKVDGEMSSWERYGEWIVGDT